MLIESNFNISNIKSVTGKKWLFQDINSDKLKKLSTHYNIPSLIIKILLNRDFDVSQNILNFLDPKLKTQLKDPFHLLDMDKAVTRITSAISNNEKIVIFGDYDVDGATSSALLKKYFMAINHHNIDIYIPDRITEGYGPNVENMKILAQNNDLCITVDCGITAFEQIDIANDNGMDVIVIDHHQSTDKLPNAIAIVNPNRFDELSEYRNLAAVGVCFLLIIAINNRLQKNNFFNQKNISTPNLIEYLDLVALGTVCDVMSITNINRVFVKQGLRILQQQNNLGLKTLLDISGLDYNKISTYHLGFVIGPRINAGGRVGESYLGSQLLTTDNYEDALKISNKLELYNNERKTIENFINEEANIQAKQKSDKAILIIASHNWHPGVIGIAASRIKDKYYKPTAIIAIENSIGKASMRSISGVDIGAAVLAAKDNGLLINGGGHAAAAGFTVKEELIPDLENFFIEFLADQYEENKKPKIKIDASISCNAVNLDIISQLELLEPYGVGNPEPRFLLSNVKVTNFNILKEKHLQCFITDDSCATTKRAMLFNAFENRMGKYLIDNIGKNIYMICTLKLNEWQGNKSVDIFIEDVGSIYNPNSYNSNIFK